MSEQALQMMTDGEEMFIARDAVHARQMQAEMVGDEWASPMKDWSIVHKPDPFTIEDEDGPESKPIADWIAERGAGYLCGEHG